jgi:hypothetical protein
MLTGIGKGRFRWRKVFALFILGAMPARIAMSHPDHPPPAKGDKAAADSHADDDDASAGAEAELDDEQSERKFWLNMELIGTGFEEGDALPYLPQGRFVDDVTHAGRRAVRFDIRENGAEIMLLPFFNLVRQRIDGEVWLRSDADYAGRIVLDVDGQRYTLGAFRLKANVWTKAPFEFYNRAMRVGMVSLIAPTPGTLWVDDLRMAQLQHDARRNTQLKPIQQPSRLDREFKLPHAEDFPAMTVDRAGTRWLGVVARGPSRPRAVCVYRLTGEARECLATLAPENVTGVDSVAVAGLGAGCVVAAAFEVRGIWRMYYAFVGTGDQPVLREIDHGTSNLAPALAVCGQRVCLAWESNGDHANRAIYASWLTPDIASTPQRLSSSDFHSANATLAAMADGTFVAAWDSYRAPHSDIFGARFRDGAWEPERQLTDTKKIERYPSLVARGDEIWMAWQMQMFAPMRHHINNTEFRRVRVARLDWKTDDVSMEAADLEQRGRYYVRPRMSVDLQGRLWVTVRHGIDRQAGWLVQAYCHPGRWEGPYLLWPYRGMTRNADLVWNDDGGVAAVQFDDLAVAGGHDNGNPWHCAVATVPVRAESPTKGRNEIVSWPPALPESPFGPIWFGQPEAHAPFSLIRFREHMSASYRPRPISHAGRDHSLYFGTLHEHTEMSVCVRGRNPTVRELYQNARDIEELDFIALTDHGYNYTQPQWAYNTEQVRAHFDGDRFVTLLGQEWTSQKVPYEPARPYKRYGHRNLIYLDPYYDTFHDASADRISPTELWSRIKGVDFVMIPHQLADPISAAPVDWTEHDDVHQPLAEIFQNRGSYEALGAPRQAENAMKEKGFFLQDAWAMGVTIGVIASPDHGGGGGKAGVWAKDLTPASLFEAFHARRTFGTSNPKMTLFVSCGAHVLGEVVARDDDLPLTFRIRAEATRPFTRLVIMRNNEIVHDINPTSKEIDYEWTDAAPPHESRLWYYVRMHRDDEELAWSSPIWFDRSSPAPPANPANPIARPAPIGRRHSGQSGPAATGDPGPSDESGAP